MAERRNWPQEEVHHALALCLVTDFDRFHSRNPDIVDLAFRIDRTPGAVALKLSNLAGLGECLPRKGMANASNMDRQVWAEFLNDPDGVLRAWEHQAVPPPATTSQARPIIAVRGHARGWCRDAGPRVRPSGVSVWA